MKNLPRYLATSAITALITLVASAAFSQRSILDPTVVSPDIYKTEFENSMVRVIRVTASNGSTPAQHSHPDRVVININQCTWLETKDDGSVAEETYAAGAVTWEGSVTHGGQVNRVKETCELLEVELK